ncbi:MAG: N-acetylmuramoyl-L-alanine amidase CwlD [Clostridia bacterium]|nr:N-acetylmuramoyl-L-alanine amidase CwlD [Clostridia bacterium]
MKFKFNFNIRQLPTLISILMVFLCVFSFSYWFYQIGMGDRHIQTLSWVVSGKRVVIDPGHGGIFPGKVNKNIKEKDINLEISKKLADFFSQSGAMVIMTRNTDTDLVDPNVNGSLLSRQRSDLQKRVELAKEYDADLFISIHCNSTPSQVWSGAQTFYDPENKESEALAKSIQREIIEQLKNTKRQALVRRDTFLFENLEIPVVIIECGFLSNPKEAELLQQEEYQYRLAYAIYSGVVKYLANEITEVNLDN